MPEEPEPPVIVQQFVRGNMVGGSLYNHQQYNVNAHKRAYMFETPEERDRQ